MQKLVLLAIAAALMGLLPRPATALVTFDFIETAYLPIQSPTEGIGAGCFSIPCPPLIPVSPQVVLSMTLSSDTETGSAHSNPTTGFPPAATVTDPNFSLSFGSIQAPFYVFPVGPVYDITWTAVAGQLTALSINYVGFLPLDSPAIGAGQYPGFDPNGFGLTGGSEYFGGSIAPTILLSGFWQEQAVPEPGSAALLLGALLAFVFWRSKGAFS